MNRNSSHVAGTKKILLQEEDCIRCGELCQPGLYCCSSPLPLTKEEARILNEKGGYKKIKSK